MADYIDRQLAKKTIGDNWVKYVPMELDINLSFVLAKLDKLPPADVVEVVRCKDCKYQDKGQNEVESWNVCNYRPWLYVNTYDDHFCSDGERKDG